MISDQKERRGGPEGPPLLIEIPFFRRPFPPTAGGRGGLLPPVPGGWPYLFFRWNSRSSTDCLGTWVARSWGRCSMKYCWAVRAGASTWSTLM